MTAAVTGELLALVRQGLAARAAPPDPATVAEVLRASGRVVDDRTVLTLAERLRREVAGFGPLEPLLARPGLTDVLVNGPREVYVDTGEGLQTAGVDLGDEEAVRRLAHRLAAQAGRRLDDASPFVDARLPDGTRLHAVLAPIARPGTVLSLRVPPRRAMPLESLVELGALEDWAADLLQRLVRARIAFLVTGGAGTGKTTLLAALLGRAHAAERIIVVEDSSELRPDHPHVVGLEARRANVEGAGEVTMRDLVRQALRMRPDRIVVGEVRGGEVVDLLAALNTGHEGGCGTVHANSAADVPARIEALGVAAGLSREAVHSQLASAIDVVLHMARGHGGRRRLVEIAALEAVGGTVRTLTAAGLSPDGALTWSPARERIEALLDARGRR